MQVRLKAIVFAAACVAGGAAFAQDMVVKIGHVAPTSGGQAHLGKDNENGARMAIDELNAKGVTIGGKKVKLELQAEDDGADPKQGTAVANKLVDSKVSGVVGHLNSSTSIPASQIYSDAGIPMITPSSTNPKLTRQGFKTVFRVCADDLAIGSTLAKYSVKEGKTKKVAVIDDRSAYGQGVAETYVKAVKEAGAKVTGQQYTTDKATDFTAILTAVKSQTPDTVFYGGMDAQAGPMLRQMQQLGMKVKYFGGDGICSTELPKLAGGSLAKGSVVCAEAGGIEAGQMAGMDDFVKRYKAKYNLDVQLYAPYVYDAVNLMVAAMVKAGSSDPKVYLPALQSTQYKGVTGNIAFDAKGDLKNAALTLYTYNGADKVKLAVVR